MNTLKLRILFGFVVLIVAQSSNLLSQYGDDGSIPSSIVSTVPGTINPAITDPTAAFDEAAANSPYQTCGNIDTPCDECPPNWLDWLLGPFSGGAGGGGCGSSCSPGNGAGGSPRLSPPIMPRLHSKVPVQYNSYTVGNSKIDNQRFNYWHWSVDAPRTAGSSLGIGRIHRTRDWSTPGSFGPGVFSNLDLRLNIAVNAWCQQGYCHEVSVFDPTSRSPIFAILPSSIIEGNDSLEPRAKNVEFFDAQMQPLSGMTQSSYDPPLPIPSYCKMNLWDGSFFKFQLINVEVPPSDSSYATPTHGRLIEAKTTTGNGYSITYKSWTQQELEASPNRLWQMDTASDISGTSFGISYSGTQQAGGWVISSVSLPGGGTVSYTYLGGLLDKVTYPDSLETTIEFEDGSNGLILMKIKDVRADPGHRFKTVGLSGAVSTVNGRVVPTAIGLVRIVANGANEVSYLNREDQYYGFTYVGGGMLKALQRQTANVQGDMFYKDGWTAGTSSMDLPVETNTPTVYADTTTLHNQGRPSGAEDERGIYRAFHYDDNSNVKMIVYDDGSFEAFYFDPTSNQLLRKRNREGHVTKYTYNANNQVLQTSVGLIDGPSNQGVTDPVNYYVYNPTDDVQTSLFAQSSNTYYTTGAATGKLESSTNENGKTTNYEYNANGRLSKIKEPADVGSGPRAETTFTYDTAGRLKTTTNPEGHVTERFYDSSGRLIKTTYADGTSERIVYGTTGNGRGLPVKQIDRMGSVTNLTYDGADRLVTRVSAAAIADANGNETASPSTATTETFQYLIGTTDKVISHTVDGRKTEYTYDGRGRRIRTKVFPKTGTTLESKVTYVDNFLFSTEDPYGRKTYYAYDASNGRQIRTVVGTEPAYTLANFTAVVNAVRSTTPNSNFSIRDIVYDFDGRVKQQFDPRGFITQLEYDARGRQSSTRAAFGTAIETRTDTLYNAAGHVIEVRTPRYFDSTDTNGSNKAREQWTYNGRGLVATHTVSPGTADAATESFTYDLGGHQATRTDFGGNVWTRYEDSCCDKKTANADPLGHGSIVNTDSMKRTVHTIQVSDVSTHVGNFSNPTDAKTLSETTTKYDALGRVTHQTTWLSPRGLVDPANPPIAGLNGVAASAGLTTQYFYDNNLADGVGLDSAGGVSALKLGTGGSGSFSVSLSAAIAKLASTPASGGASVSFSATAPGRATVTVSPEDEISFSISDAAGRSVMSGKLNNYRGSGATALNTLSTWSCTQHDSTDTLSGYGTVLVLKNIDPLGSTTQSWTDGAGRTLKSIDQAGNATVMTYDAGGNQLSVRDANNVGADMVYDALGRNTQRTDTAAAVTKTEYDKSGNAIKQTDAKNKHTFISFDSRNRRKSTTDRINAATNFAYTALGQLASLTDAENQTTSYTYDSRGSKLTETYPDHTPSTSPGQTGYGIVTFTYDNAGRVLRKRDQLGDTCTYNYDLAGRMTSRNYRTLANSPSGTIADTDTFTFDKAGRMLTAVNARYTNTVTYAYDPVGRKASESLTISGRTYTIGTEYNSRGEMIKQTYPDGSISDRTYHATGALNQLKLDSSTVSTRTYDAGRRLTSDVLGNGITETRTYSNDNLLTAINYSNASLGNLTYTWDTNKNKKSESIGGVMSGYGFTNAGTTYDDEDRLTGYQRTNGALSQSWNLTAVGDWNSVTTNGTAQSRTHGPTHELLTSGGQTVNTDVKGNITLLPAALSSLASTALGLQWDFDNKLKSVDVGNNSSTDVEYKYDALGRRVARVGSSGSFVYIQSDQQTIADYGVGDAPSSPLYRYVYASYIDEPVVRKGAGTGGTIHYFHRNQQYSITTVTTSSGNVAERYAYSAYGEPTILDGSGSVLSSSAINNRYSYTGREWDATVGLYHFRARWMSPKTGRFLGRDPIGYKGSKWNLCFQMRNSPLHSVDFDGKRQRREPIDATLIMRPKDRDGIKNMPWGNTDLSGLSSDIEETLGFSLPGVRAFCQCAEDCDGKFYIVDAIIEIDFFIWIDQAALLSDPIEYTDDPDRHSLQGVYGHEQGHILNMINAAPDIVSALPVDDSSFETSSDCKKACDRWERNNTEPVAQAVIQFGGHSDPNRLPKQGIDLPPIGGVMPSKPDPKHMPAPIPPKRPKR